MFTGSVPKPVVEQILKVIPFADWKDVYVCCSGSFRVDSAIKQNCPGVAVHSNDVSLLTVGLGKLLRGEDFDVTFKDRLQFVEDFIGEGDLEARMSAVLVALEMSRYAGKNVYAQSHFNHYQVNFQHFYDRARLWMDKFQAETKIDSFYAGDFRDHSERAVNGGGVVAFPPTYKSGYESLYKFLHGNTTWTEPEYRLFDPKDLKPWIDGLGEREIPYCVFSDQVFADLERVAEFHSATNHPIYIYANKARDSSLRRKSNRAEPFKYKIVEPDLLTPQTEVKVVPMQSCHMNYLKDIYLSKGIHHAMGMFNYAVFLDGKLAGGFIFSLSKYGDIESLYMLSDFSLVREGRIAKLIALIASSREVMAPIERKRLMRIKELKTTAFTDKPVSMKYRGIYELHSRKEGQLQYHTKIREQTVKQIYQEWFKKNSTNSQAHGQNRAKTGGMKISSPIINKHAETIVPQIKAMLA